VQEFLNTLSILNTTQSNSYLLIESIPGLLANFRSVLAWPALGQVISSWADNNFNFSLSVTLMHASAPRSSCRSFCPSRGKPPAPFPPPTHISGWPCEINNWWLVVWGPLASPESLKSGLWTLDSGLQTERGRSPDTLPVHHTTQWRIQSRFWPGPNAPSVWANKCWQIAGQTEPIKDIYVWSLPLHFPGLAWGKWKVGKFSETQSSWSF